MPAVLGYRLIYATMMQGRDESERLEINAILRMPGSEEAYDEHRQQAIAMAGIEIGGR